ncbi:MAG: OmpA family protein [Saprospiraceae bacterium]|nr:OmpA family protein [Saprospiraceae bacterium]
MASRLTTFGKLTITFLIVGALFGIYKFLQSQGYLNPKDTQQSQVIEKVDLPDAPKNAASTVSPANMPGSSPARLSTPEVRWLLWAWNAHMGLMFANGGGETTEGSIMAAKKVNLKLSRQDDVSQMQANLVKFAEEYKNNPASARGGAQFVSVMGDGAAAFLAGVNPQLEKLGKDYRAQVIYTCGRSLGEDKFMGPPAWKQNPQTARGGVCTAVLRDGDWNIVIKWCADNGIPVNSDETTYDADAMNFIAADTYIDASEKYINGYSEERDEVKNGKRTGKKVKVNVTAVTTWTPGDVMVAQRKGGLVSIVSTREYRSQMPCVVIGIKKWMEDNRTTVENMIEGIAAGGDQVKSYSPCLKKAAEISAGVYKEESPEYWEKYYTGVVETDKKGLSVELGGSRVNNLADNLEMFGLTPGSTNIFKIVYTTFGDIVKKLYPDLVPSYPAADDITNLSFLKNVAAKAGSNISSADQATFNADDNIRQTVSKKSWSIEFETGKSSFTPAASRELERLFNDLVIAGNLKVEVHGHTDNVGDFQANMQLSERRAFAIKQWLEQKSASNFPEGRISVRAFGSTNPVASNDAPDGRAKNRRVEIIMGN